METWTYVKTHSARCMTEELAARVREKYHFAPEDGETLLKAGKRLAAGMEGREGFYIRLSGIGGERRTGNNHHSGAAVKPAEKSENVRCAAAAPGADVILTLGPHADTLQEAYQRKGLYPECYMVETLCSELLRICCRELETWLLKRTGYHIRRYHFYGSGTQPDRELSRIPALLKESGQKAVACTGGYCLIPKKSVVFAAELTPDRKESCPNICLSCGKRACPNREASF